MSTPHKAASVTGGFKRSRSSEGLSSIAESTPPAKAAAPVKQTESLLEKGGSREALPARQSSPTSLRKRIEMLEAKEGGKRQLKSSSKTKQKETDTKRKRETVSPVAEAIVPGKKRTVSPGPEVSVSPKPGKMPGSPKSRQKGIFRFFSERSKSKSPSPTPSSDDDDDDETESAERGRPRAAESPTKSYGETKLLTAAHPLSVAKQAGGSHKDLPAKEVKSLNKTERQSAGDDESEATASVADIVKRLDPQQPSTEQTTVAKKKKGKSKKDTRMKQKEKQLLKGSTEEGREKKEGEGKSGRIRLFFRSKKSYDVAKASSGTNNKSSSPKPKKKKKSKSEREHVHQLAKKPPLSLQDRIQRLKELGVETDSPDMVLTLDELNELEAQSGLLLREEGAGDATAAVLVVGEEKEEEEGEEEEEVDYRGRSVSPGYSEEGLVSSDSVRSRSTSPVVYSSASGGTEEARSGSRGSHHSSVAATCGGSERGVSPMVWRDASSPSGGEEEATREEDAVVADEDRVERRPSVIETVRQLEPLSATCSVSSVENAHRGILIT